MFNCMLDNTKDELKLFRLFVYNYSKDVTKRVSTSIASFLSILNIFEWHTNKYIKSYTY